MYLLWLVCVCVCVRVCVCACAFVGCMRVCALLLFYIDTHANLHHIL